MSEPSTSRGGTDVPEESATNSTSTSTRRSPRWRFDIDLNFDPSWLVPQSGSGRQIAPALNMLNDWMRPYGFRRSNSENNDFRPPDNTSTFETTPLPRSSSSSARGLQSPNANVSSPPGETQTTSPIAQTVSNAIQGCITSNAGRSRSSYQNITIEGNSPGGTRNNSDSYVVDMEAEGNNWSQQPTAGGNQTTHSNVQNHGHSHEHSPEEGERRRSSDSQRDEHEPPTTTASELLRQSPEGQALLSVAERYSPFLLILLIKGLFDHGSGIVCFLALLLAFTHANSLFKKEVSKQGKRKLSYLLMITANLLVCMGFIFYVYQDEKLYLGLLFLPTRTPISSMWTMFWVTGVVDFVAKFITIIIKVVVLVCPGRVCPYQKRGKYYLFVERTSQLYRTAIPTYSWVLYMSGTYEGPSSLIGGVLVLLYSALKTNEVCNRYKYWKVAFRKMLQQVHYGCKPSDAELEEAGDVCPICHDNFHDPTKLSCNHIFCEECVTTWFDRERTCPMCRARVVDDPSYRDGQTTHFIQIF